MSGLRQRPRGLAILWVRLRSFWVRPAAVNPEVRRALDLLAAVDAGGVPLNPARVNQIARDLGLEVSSRARVDETIERIRAAVRR
ncbi:MAG: hypothetical protein ACO3YN_06440 [Rubrivivax sp.]